MFLRYASVGKEILFLITFLISNKKLLISIDNQIKIFGSKLEREWELSNKCTLVSPICESTCIIIQFFCTQFIYDTNKNFTWTAKQN